MTKSYPRLLIINEQKEQLTCMRLLALASPYKTVMKSNGVEAFQYLLDNPNTISLILSDINMANMEGLEFLSKIKADPNLRNIPVILQSVATNDEAQKALALGADWFLQKPYKATELYIAIAMLRPKILVCESAMKQTV